jgi:hypothetical protein
MTITSFEHLTKQIENVIQEHIAATRRAAESAVARALAAVGAGARRSSATAPRLGRRRAPAEIGLLGEQLYRAVCAKPGETMAVLAADVGAHARQLQRPMTHLKRDGRVRSVGQRHLTRYFPIAERATRPA